MRNSTSVSYMEQRSAAPFPMAWIPVAFGVLAICFESTRFMGAGNTSHWLGELLRSSDAGFVGELNHILRKSGHFTGYGLLGLLFAQGWFATLRSRFGAAFMALRTRAAALGIGCAFLVACCDEWHQLYTPGRGASFYDVLLDTSGALALNLLYWGFVTIRRQRMLPAPVQLPVRMKTSYRMMRKTALRSAAEHTSTRRAA